MWYFTWFLGLTAALGVAIINVMWYEAQTSFDEADRQDEKSENS